MPIISIHSCKFRGLSEGPVARAEGTYLSRLASLSQLTSNLQAVDSCRRELDCTLCTIAQTLQQHLFNNAYSYPWNCT